MNRYFVLCGFLGLSLFVLHDASKAASQDRLPANTRRKLTCTYSDMDHGISRPGRFVLNISRPKSDTNSSLEFDEWIVLTESYVWRNLDPTVFITSFDMLESARKGSDEALTRGIPALKDNEMARLSDLDGKLIYRISSFPNSNQVIVTAKSISIDVDAQNPNTKKLNVVDLATATGSDLSLFLKLSPDKNERHYFNLACKLGP